MSALEQQQEQLSAADGYPLAVRHYVPKGEVRRAVLLVPAMGVVQRFYEAFSIWMAQQGVAVTTFDFRGVGQSAPARLRGFEASITDWAEKDLTAVVAAFHIKWADVPRTYLGHSLGGQLFGWVNDPHRFDHVVTVASGNGYWRLNSPQVRNKAPLLWWLLAPVGVALVGYFPGKRLGAVGDLPAKVMWQWRKWCLHPEYLAAEGEVLRQRYAQVRQPIHVVLAEDDELVSPEGIRQLYRLYSNADVSFQEIQPQQCGMKFVGHFGVFKSQARETLWPQALRWIDQK